MKRFQKNRKIKLKPTCYNYTEIIDINFYI